MTPAEIAQGLWDLIKAVLPLLLSGSAGALLIHLNNRNEREKISNRQANIENNAEQVKLDAQALVNQQFAKFIERTDKLTLDLAQTREQFAEERGGLKQQISGLEAQLQAERTAALGRSDANTKSISELEAKIEALVKQQEVLEGQVQQVVAERERLVQSLKDKIEELEAARLLLQQTQQQVDALLAETNRLRTLLEIKDKELEALRLQLGEKT